MSRGLGAFLSALALRALLRRLDGGSKRTSRAPADRAATPARPLPPRPLPPRPAVTMVALAAIAIGAPLMLIFDSAPTRIVGVLALFTFIVAGVFAVADPAFLAAEDRDRDGRR